MVVFALLLELLGYAIKIILIISFWLVVLSTVFNWLNLSNKHPLIKFVRILTDPVFMLLRKKFPFLIQREIDFTPMLILFFIIFMHLLVVNTLLEAALRLK